MSTDPLSCKYMGFRISIESLIGRYLGFSIVRTSLIYLGYTTYVRSALTFHVLVAAERPHYFFRDRLPQA